MRLPNLHTAPKRHLIKFRTFLKKNDSFFLKNISSYVLKGLNSGKFLEIVNRNKTPNKFSTQNHFYAFKFLSQAIFNLFENTHPLGSERLNFRIFSFILHHKYPNNLY